MGGRDYDGQKKAPWWRCSVDGCRFGTPAGNRTLIKGLGNLYSIH